MPLLRPQAREGAWRDPSSPISYKLSQGEEKNPFPTGFGNSRDMRDMERWQHRGGNSPAGCSSLGKLALPGWCNALSSHTTLFPPTCSHHETPLGHLHMSVNWKIAIRNFLKNSWWRNQCRYIELLGSRLLVYVWKSGFYITEPWQGTHLEGHTGADRMDRQQKLDSQAVPLRYLADPIS